MSVAWKSSKWYSPFPDQFLFVARTDTNNYHVIELVQKIGLSRELKTKATTITTYLSKEKARSYLEDPTEKNWYVDDIPRCFDTSDMLVTLDEHTQEEKEVAATIFYDDLKHLKKDSMTNWKHSLAACIYVAIVEDYCSFTNMEDEELVSRHPE